MSALFDRVVSERPDGVILSIPSTTIVAAALTQFENAGIAAMSMNSGYETVGDIAYSKRPSLHVGQDEAVRPAGSCFRGLDRHCTRHD
jgi:hypothetical protein